MLSGLTGLYLDISGKAGFPTWLWIVLLGIAMLIVPFIAFHKLRLERDQLKARLNDTPSNGVVVLREPPKMTIYIDNYDFGLSGDNGYPLVDALESKSRWIRLGIVFDGNVFLETLELVISGKKPISAFEWKPSHAAYYHYFKIPNWVQPTETRSIQVRAFGNGTIWGSPEQTITFPVL